MRFKHEPNKKGKGKGQPRSPSPTSSPHRISKSDGKEGDTPKLTGKSPSGKANKLPCMNFKKGSSQKGNACNYEHFPECAEFKTPVGCKFGDQCVYKHTARSADEKKISATIAILIPPTDERQMQLQKVRPDDKAQFRVRRNHLANRYVLKRETLGPVLGLIQDPQISELQTLQHSGKDPSNGPCA